MKKGITQILCASLFVSILNSSAVTCAKEIQQAHTEVVAPLLSIKRLSMQIKQLRVAIDRFKRCTITGPCTKEEIQEVKQEIKTGLAVTGALLVVTLGYWKGVPYAKRKLHEAIETAKGEVREIGQEVGKRFATGAIEQAKGQLPTPEQLGGEVAKYAKATFTKTKDEFNAEITKLMETAKGEVKEIGQEVGKGFATGAIEQAEKHLPTPERFGEKVAVYARATFAKTAKEFDAEITKLNNLKKKVSSQEFKEQAQQKINAWVEWFSTMSKSEIQKILSDDLLRGKLTEFINSVMDATSIKGLFEQLGRGVKITTTRAGALGLPQEIKIELAAPQDIPQPTTSTSTWSLPSFSSWFGKTEQPVGPLEGKSSERAQPEKEEAKETSEGVPTDNDDEPESENQSLLR